MAKVLKDIHSISIILRMLAILMFFLLRIQSIKLRTLMFLIFKLIILIFFFKFLQFWEELAFGEGLIIAILYPDKIDGLRGFYPPGAANHHTAPDIILNLAKVIVGDIYSAWEVAWRC